MKSNLLTPPNPTFFPKDNEKDILPFLKTLFLKYLIGQEYLIKFLIYLFKETEVWILKKYIFIKLSKQFKMKNQFSVAKATLQSQMSIILYITTI